jgi:hypothetical protein
MSEDVRAAVAAGVLPADDSFRELLQSIVDVARAILGARASSIFLLDEATDELVFEAVSGEGAALLGHRFPSGISSACSRARRRSRSTCSRVHAAPSRRSKGATTRSRGSARRSSGSRTAPPRIGCSARSRTCSTGVPS